MNTWLDQLGNEIVLANKPQRIISLVPSQTELLFDLGLDHEIVGITQFCVHSKGKVESKAKIGGTKRFLFNKIAELEPDLIIGNKEENYLAGITQLQKDYPVWMSDVKTLADAYNMIMAVGDMVGKYREAELLLTTIKRAFSKLQTQNYERLRVAYLIWRKPLMVVANNTFITAMLKEAGLTNVFDDMERYPEITEDLLSQKKPEVILLSSEPYPFQDKHTAEFQKVCPSAKVMIVDGQLFSWYGSRLQYSPDYLMRCREQMRNFV